MMERFSYTNSEFDEYAANYDAALSQGLSVSGEDKNFFARGRIEWLRQCLNRIEAHPRRMMDFGCGIGSAAPYLLELLDAEEVVGVDVSEKSLAAARHLNGSVRARFLSFDEYDPKEEIDLAFCNGVFHHIPIEDRAAALGYIYRSLRPGGLFALWENNPFNPGTRLVMSRIPFDKDAVTLTSGEAKRMLRAGGFEILRTDFLFIFPKFLSRLRFIEPMVSRLPLGAQYQALCRKPLN
ncbi:MAG TPA: methyltransferase [Blastocatellia bacterium]|jgi:SAM-dependent methyltransferase